MRTHQFGIDYGSETWQQFGRRALAILPKAVRSRRYAL
jgi:hypothetical protein